MSDAAIDDVALRHGDACTPPARPPLLPSAPTAGQSRLRRGAQRRGNGRTVRSGARTGPSAEYGFLRAAELG